MIRLARREPTAAALLALLFLLFTLFVGLPLYRVLAATLIRDGGVTLELWRGMLTRHGALVPLWNSLRLAAVVAVAATIVGFIAAFSLTHVALPGRRAFRVIATLPMLAPPFMIALAAIMLLGRNGVITRGLLEPLFGPQPINIYGFGGLVLVQTLTFFPLSMLLLVSTLSGIDPALEEAAQSQGASPSRVFSDVVLPLAVPGILSSLLLIFVESLADFGNPLILGGDFRVLSVAAFLRITGEFDTAGGAILATLLLVPALSAFVVQRRYVGTRTWATLTGRPSAPRRLHATRSARVLAAASWLLIGGAAAGFYAAVLYGSVVTLWGVDNTLTIAHYSSSLRQAGPALADSLLLAGIAAPVAAAIGMATAWLLTRRKFIGSGALATLAMLTFAVPGTVIGIGYVLAFNTAPLQLTGTASIIVLLFIFRSVPVSLEAGRNGIAQVDAAIEESSASLGARPFTTWLRVALPLAAPALFTGLAHAFVRSLTAVSAVIFVVSGQWNLVTVSILGYVENADLGRASALCMILVAIVSAVLGVVQVATGRMRGRT
jgi:iron(III) transport system permease protein